MGEQQWLQLGREGSRSICRLLILQYARKFGNEERIGKLAGIFAILAIFISCLGMLGLASYITERRTKEIALRKVLGTTLFDLWSLVSREFALLVSISCLCAFPIAWFVLIKWLETYTYRVALELWIFASAAIGTLIITLITISYQSISSAGKTPVKSLRSE